MDSIDLTSDAEDVEHSNEICCVFLEAGCENSHIFHFAEKAFDNVKRYIEIGIVRRRITVVALCRDDALYALVCDLPPDHPATILAADELFRDIGKGLMLSANRTYDADLLREMVLEKGGWTNIPPNTSRTALICFSPRLYKKRNLVERFSNKRKYYRSIATRYEKLTSPIFAVGKLVCIRLRLRHYDSTAY